MGQGLGLLPFAHRYPVLRYKEKRDCVGCGWRSPFFCFYVVAEVPHFLQKVPRQRFWERVEGYS